MGIAAYRGAASMQKSVAYYTYVYYTPSQLDTRLVAPVALCKFVRRTRPRVRSASGRIKFYIIASEFGALRKSDWLGRGVGGVEEDSK